MANTPTSSTLRAPHGDLVLVVAAGAFNKFAQGPSDLFVLRCDRRGRRRHDAKIPQGRMLISSMPVALATADTVAVLSTLDALPDISAVDVTASYRFRMRVAVLNQQLDLVRTLTLPDSDSPTAGLFPLPPTGALAVMPGGRHVRFTAVTLPRGHTATRDLSVGDGPAFVTGKSNPPMLTLAGTRSIEGPNGSWLERVVLLRCRVSVQP